VGHKFELDKKLIIDDSNWRDHVMPISTTDKNMSQSGYIPRDYSAVPFGSYGDGVSAVPPDLLYDEKQLKEIFTEQNAKGTSLKHIIDRAPKRWLNQSPTNYCWCYAVVHGVMIIRYVNNLPFERLSPYSVAAMIKQGRNNGGWGSQALTYIINNGVASEEFWPAETETMSSSQRESANMAAIRNWRQYADSSRADAAKRKVKEFYELRPRDWLAKLSLIARRIPVPSGYNWMGHEMCSIQGVILPNGQLGCIDMDHYGSNGNYNSRIMTESKGTPDDAVAPVVSEANFV
jgi:hypothetical protein